MEENNFKKAIQKYSGKKIYIGFSGGADSTALLLLLNLYSKEFKLKLEAVHFDHQLRPESSEDAKWCMHFCEARMIPFNSIFIDVLAESRNGESIEATARRLRLEQWEKITAPEEFIALGHHNDDRVENAFIRLCRGSNVSGITSMREVQVINGMTFIRPLLSWSKEDICKFLNKAGVKFWREDHSNKDSRFKRNFFRNQVLPEIYKELSFSKKGLSRSVEVMEQDAELLEELAEKKFEHIRGQEKIQLEWLNGIHQALRIRVLRMWLSQHAGEDVIPDRNLLKRISDMGKISTGSLKRIPVKGNINLKVRNGKLSLEENKSRVKGMNLIEWDWKREENIHFCGKAISAEIVNPEDDHIELNSFNTVFPVDKIPEIIVIRSWLEGDRMTPYKKHTPVKLKKLFADRKVPAEKKLGYPVFTLPDGMIFWVGGLRRSNFAPVGYSTGKAVMFTIKQP